MNTKNLEFLKDSLKYLGFGEKLNADLENQIKQQPLEFKLGLIGEFDKDSVKKNIEYTLDFKKSDQSDMYFLNKYQATLKNENPELDKTQTFYITKNSGVTAKEAPGATSAPGLRSGFPATLTQPRRIRSAARDRDGATPLSTNN